jgi:hypothetical protein
MEGKEGGLEDYSKEAHNSWDAGKARTVTSVTSVTCRGNPLLSASPLPWFTRARKTATPFQLPRNRRES